jgi:hypothetical protein
MKENKFPKIYDIPTTAEAIGIKPRVLRYWIEKKEIIPIPIGGRYYFTPELVQKLLENKLEEIENKEQEELDE